MFSNALIAFICAVGVAGWAYAKAMRSTGNNSQNSLIVAGVAALIAFLVVHTLLGFIPAG